MPAGEQAADLFNRLGYLPEDRSTRKAAFNAHQTIHDQPPKFPEAKPLSKVELKRLQDFHASLPPHDINTRVNLPLEVNPPEKKPVSKGRKRGR